MQPETGSVDLRATCTERAHREPQNGNDGDGDHEVYEREPVLAACMHARVRMSVIHRNGDSAPCGSIVTAARKVFSCDGATARNGV
ncbi:MAG: hypothetical protein NVS3B17_04320 [Vulcanimicrobiaceae bacterium]